MKRYSKYLDWDKLRNDFGKGGKFLYCSLEKLDDPDGSWLRGFNKEARKNGASVVTAGGHLYVRFDYHVERSGLSCQVYKGSSKLGHASQVFDGSWHWIPWCSGRGRSRKGRELVDCIATGLSLPKKTVERLLEVG